MKQMKWWPGILLGLMVFAGLGATAQKSRDYYVLKTWWCSTQAQIDSLNKYLGKTYLPWLHEQGIDSKVGIFKPVNQDTAVQKRVIVFIPVIKLQKMEALESALEKQDPFVATGNAFSDAPYNQPAFTRVETTVLKAFSEMPHWEVPMLKSGVADKIYELRSYEGASEQLYRRKVHMFNEGGEIALFARLGFNAVFYAQVLAGARMPNLMYMTSFENMAERDAHWKAFGADPEWKKLSSMPQYLNTVSKSDILLMKATEYSEW
jgi:hypothetical protein